LFASPPRSGIIFIVLLSDYRFKREKTLMACLQKYLQRAKTFKAAPDDLSGEERKRLDRMLRVNIYVPSEGLRSAALFVLCPPARAGNSKPLTCARAFHKAFGLIPNGVFPRAAKWTTVA
jgi:hypothetical protein